MNFLSAHILHVTPYANLNRDDVGAPKTMIYGGAHRARLSSQSLKRAARTRFEALSPADRTTRSRMVQQRLRDRVEELRDEWGLGLDDAQRRELDKKLGSKINTLTKKDTGDDGEDSETLVWLAEHEVEVAARQSLLAAAGQGNGDGEWLSAVTDSLTIAGFGRMLANRPDLGIEGAVQVAHAFTTHPAEIEVDWFTAVDDLRTEIVGDEGAGHLNVGQFTSGVMYRYFNIDRRQLLTNWSGADKPDAQSRLREWVAAMVLQLPRGKENATAPHTLPSLVLLEEGSQPASFATAFEAPVRDGREGLLVASADRLDSYRDTVRKAFPSMFGESQRLAAIPGKEASGSADALADFAAEWILEGR